MENHSIKQLAFKGMFRKEIFYVTLDHSVSENICGKISKKLTDDSSTLYNGLLRHVRMQGTLLILLMSWEHLSSIVFIRSI